MHAVALFYMHYNFCRIQKRGIAVALRKAKAELGKLDRLVKGKRTTRSNLEQRIRKTLGREHLSRFVITEIGGNDKQPTLRWHVDAALRRKMEKTRLGRRVLCATPVDETVRPPFQRRRSSEIPGAWEAIECGSPNHPL